MTASKEWINPPCISLMAAPKQTNEWINPRSLTDQQMTHGDKHCILAISFIILVPLPMNILAIAKSKVVKGAVDGNNRSRFKYSTSLTRDLWQCDFPKFWRFGRRYARPLNAGFRPVFRSGSRPCKNDEIWPTRPIRWSFYLTIRTIASSPRLSLARKRKMPWQIKTAHGTHSKFRERHHDITHTSPLRRAPCFTSTTWKLEFIQKVRS